MAAEAWFESADMQPALDTARTAKKWVVPHDRPVLEKVVPVTMAIQVMGPPLVVEP
jgi:hypothetical protein